MTILPPLPSEEHRKLVCGDDWRDFLAIGASMAEMLKKLDFLAPGTRILDIGCGCGRLARHLLTEPIASYRGFDRHPGMIAWSTKELASRDERFSFDCFPIRSVYDQLDGNLGTVAAAGFSFPYPGGAFDSIVAASVFTHMPPAEVARYLANIGRVMAARGKALVSVFVPESGEVESDGFGFYLPRHEFEGLCAAAGLASHLLFAPCTGPVHNWYRLEHPDR